MSSLAFTNYKSKYTNIKKITINFINIHYESKTFTQIYKAKNVLSKVKSYIIKNNEYKVNENVITNKCLKVDSNDEGCY